MTPEQTVTGLSEVHGLQIRDQAFAMGIHEAVDANAVLLDDVVAAIGRLQAQMAIVVATSDQTTADVKSLKEYAEQEDARLDTQLRIGLERMGTRLETANTELMVKLAALEGIATSGGEGGSRGGPGGPTDPPGLDNLAPIQATIQAIEQTLRELVSRVNGIEGAQDNAQAKVMALHGEHEHLEIFLGKENETLKGTLRQELEAVKSFVQQNLLAATSPMAPPTSATPPQTSTFGASRGPDPWDAGPSPWDSRAEQAEQVYMGTPPGRLPSVDPSRALQRWALHDEKYVLSGKG